jgi:excisionase family DNA binding protein
MKTERAIRFWERYVLTVEEAADYFHVGESKLRRIIDADKGASFLLWNGNRPLIKRTLFEKYIDQCNLV